MEQLGCNKLQRVYTCEYNKQFFHVYECFLKLLNMPKLNNSLQELLL